MIKNLWSNVVSFLIGIRYQPNFGFPEKSGAMFDDILYQKGSNFGPDIFTKVRTGVKDRILFNPETRDRLSVDEENLIFELFTNDKDNIDKQVDSFQEQILHDLLIKYSLTRIQRIGFIYRFEINNEQLSKSLVDRTIGENLEGVNNINLRFSKKKITSSLAEKGENDYQNIIYNLKKVDDSDTVSISIDFQHHYNPFLEETSLIEFTNFKKTVDRYNKREVKNWLNQNFLSAYEKKEAKQRN